MASCEWESKRFIILSTVFLILKCSFVTAEKIKLNLWVNAVSLCENHLRFLSVLAVWKFDSSTSSPSSRLDSALMGGAVNAAWWWSALAEGVGVSHLCCLCAASLAASSTCRLKGGVRRQMLNDSLKATAPALISSPVCAGCHSNWPEHLKGWVTLQYIYWPTSY